MFGAAGERCFRAGDGQTRIRTDAIRRFRFPSRLYFFFPAAIPVAACVRARARACFFLFPDENVMSEVEIAAATGDRARRAEGANRIRTRVTKL